jgi:SMI1 / KNR4 family (SUKH-1)
MPPYNAPSWKILVSKLIDDAEFGGPADEVRLAAVDGSGGVPLPPDLTDFLSEANGLTADYGSGVIWPVEDILRRNREFRSSPDFLGLYMPFDNLLFFGDDVGGDQFAFAIQADGRIHRRDIFRWEHESDARSWYASHLEQYLDRRLSSDDN